MRPTLLRLALAGLVTGVVDGTFSSVLSVAFYHSTVSRLFQGVASVLLGPEALNGGRPTAALGILMHFTFSTRVAASSSSRPCTGRSSGW
jgi:hypothetical protein